MLELENYIVTKDGRVYNKKTHKFQTQNLTKNGYYTVSIRGKRSFVHRLVALCHIPNPDNLPQVNHIDGDKTNNNVNNLEWVTPQENINHSIRTGLCKRREKLTKEDVLYIKAHPEVTCKKLSENFGVNATTIGHVRRGDTWKNISSSPTL